MQKFLEFLVAPTSAEPVVGPPLLVASLVAMAVVLLIVVGGMLLGRELKRRKGLQREPRKQTQQRRDVKRKAAISAADEKPVTLNIDAAEREELLENARMLARDNPDKTAEMLRGWLKEDK